MNHFIAVYRTDGTQLNVIKCHEGFMGARTGLVSCLTLHPYRSALAAGYVDCNLSVYTGDGRRWPYLPFISNLNWKIIFFFLYSKLCAIYRLFFLLLQVETLIVFK